MVIVVTGGIGSGKSEVCRMLVDMYGCSLYEADSKAKELYVRCPRLLQDIEQALSCRLTDDENVFQPSFLAARIFTDRNALEIVEGLLFPYLKADFREFAESTDNIIIFESATILEKKGLDDIGDKVILVDAPYELRLERACKRDGAEREAVIDRMSNQTLMNSGHACRSSRVDEVIMNDGSVDNLEKAVREVMDRILTEYNNKQ